MTSSALLVSLLVGAALIVAAYSIWRLVMDLGGAETIYRDRPPYGFRLLWPLVNIMANTFGMVIAGKREEGYTVRLRRAGQEYALTAQQFFGGKVTGLLIAGSVAWMLAGEGQTIMALVLGGGLGWMYPDIWLREHTKKRNLVILKSLPFFLDIVTLSIESGLNLTGAISQALDKCKPGPLVIEFNRVLRDIRTGKPRVDSLRDLAERLDFGPISSLVSALVQGELMGSSLAPILRAQSDQRRTERFLRAEKLAMEAPVKMLGPLILFIFPCTFAVIGFPIVMKFLGSGF